MIDRDAAMTSLRGWLGAVSGAEDLMCWLHTWDDLSYGTWPSRPGWSFWTADSSQTPPGAGGDWFPLSGQHRGEYQGLLVGAAGLTPRRRRHHPFDFVKESPDQVDLENGFEQFRVTQYARPLARQGL
jgi:hypothetical protein